MYFFSLMGYYVPWCRHQMEAFSALLAICAGNSPVTGEFPTQRQLTRSFYVFIDLRLNKLLSKKSWGWWFKTPSRPLWRHSNDGRLASIVWYIEISNDIDVLSALFYVMKHVVYLVQTYRHQARNLIILKLYIIVYVDCIKCDIQVWTIYGKKL